MASKNKFRDMAYKAKVLEPENSTLTGQGDDVEMSHVQNDVTSPSDTLIQKSPDDISNEKKNSLIPSTNRADERNGRLAQETLSCSSYSGSGSENASPTKSHGTASSRDNLAQNLTDTRIQQSTSPPTYSSLGFAKLASFDNSILISSSSMEADQMGDFSSPSPLNSPDVTYENEKGLTVNNENPEIEKNCSKWDRTKLKLQGLQANDGASNIQGAGQNSDVSPGHRFFGAALAVRSAIRLSRMERAKRRAKWAGKKFLVFLLSQIGLTVLVLLYATGGGFLFRWLEMDAEVGRKRNMDHIRDFYLLRMWNETASLNILHPVNWSRSIGVILKDFEMHIIEAISDGFWDEANDQNAAKWTIPGSFLFSTTIITSIGYGDITPKTTAGKLVCIPYAIVGIPLTLVCLANIGQLLASCVRFAWRRVAQFLRCLANPLEKGEECKETRVPVCVSLFIMLGYIVLGAVLFSSWEKGWSFLDGLYFCFITLSTIGLGDFVPGQYESGTNERRVVCTLYLLVGLALLSTVFQLMVDSVMDVFGKFAILLGLSKEQIKEGIQDPDNPTVHQTQVIDTDSTVSPNDDAEKMKVDDLDEKRNYVSCDASDNDIAVIPDIQFHSEKETGDNKIDKIVDDIGDEKDSVHIGGN